MYKYKYISKSKKKVLCFKIKCLNKHLNLLL